MTTQATLSCTFGFRTKGADIDPALSGSRHVIEINGIEITIGFPEWGGTRERARCHHRGSHKAYELPAPVACLAGLVGESAVPIKTELRRDATGQELWLSSLQWLAKQAPSRCSWKPLIQVAASCWKLCCGSREPSRSQPWSSSGAWPQECVGGPSTGAAPKQDGACGGASKDEQWDPARESFYFGSTGAPTSL